tara:strand:- start:48 stop:329 length:282 start_codon:yes stop_codon:yes gene_type:complete
MKAMKVKKVGKRLYNSYSEWRDNIAKQQQILDIRTNLVSAIDKVKNKLNSYNDKVLGENNIFTEIHQMRKKTTELKEYLIKSIKSKQWQKEKM